MCGRFAVAARAALCLNCGFELNEKGRETSKNFVEEFLGHRLDASRSARKNVEGPWLVAANDASGTSSRKRHSKTNAAGESAACGDGHDDGQPRSFVKVCR